MLCRVLCVQRILSGCRLSSAGAVFVMSGRLCLGRMGLRLRFARSVTGGFSGRRMGGRGFYVNAGLILPNCAGIYLLNFTSTLLWSHY